MAVDGSLKFDTKIDNKGFIAGTKSIGNSLGSLKSSLLKVGAAVGVAFSVKALADYSAASKTAYQTQLLQEQKLITVMRQRMGATDESIQSILDLTAAEQGLGIIGDEIQLAGAQQVSTFLNQTESLKELIPAMNNLLAQQNGYDATTSDAVSIGNMFGKVMQGQTSALTRVGITFSDAEEQILKYGTETEKAAALAKVVTNNVGKMNNVLAQTDTGRQKQLSNTMGDIQEQFGKAITQIQILFLPVLQNVADALSTVATYARQVAQFISEAFSNTTIAETATDNQATAIKTAVNNQEDLTDAVEETAKAADNSAASFDQINKLADNSSSSEVGESGTGSGTGTSSGLGIEATVETSGLEKSIDRVKSLLGDFNGDFTSYLQTAFGTAGSIVLDLFDTFNMVFADIWSIAAFPMLEDFIKIGLPMITQFKTKAIHIFGLFCQRVKKLFDLVWEEAVKPVLGRISARWEALMLSMNKFWEKWGNPIFTGIENCVNDVFGTIENIWNTILKPIFDNIMAKADEIWAQHLQPLVDNFLNFVGEFVTGATTIYDQFISPIVNWLIETFGPSFVEIFNTISNIIGTVVGFIIDLFSGMITSATGLIEFFTGVFTGDWDKAWSGIQGMFQGVIDNIVAVWNGLCGVISTFAGHVYRVLIEPVVNFFAGLWNGIKNIFSGVAKWFNEKVIQPVVNFFKPIVDSITGIFRKIWEIISALFGVAAKWFNEKVITPIVDFFRPIVETIGGFFSGLWNKICDIFGGVGSWFGEKFSQAWEAIKKAFSSVGKFFQDIWNNIVETFGKVGTTIGNAVSDAFKAVVNTILGFIEDTINVFIDGINGVVGVVNCIPGVSIDPLERLEIPRLATGTVVPANYGEFAAILGDNKRETEVVSPLSTMKQALKEALAESGGGGGDITIVCTLDGEVVFKNVVKRNKKNTKITGKNALAY